MADSVGDASEADISALSSRQAEILQQYISVTAQSEPEAIALLQRCEWNPQIAITRFFDGEPPQDEVPQPLPRNTLDRQTMVLNELASTPTSLQPRSRLPPAGRIVRTPLHLCIRAASSLLSSFILPLNILLGVISKLFQLFHTRTNGRRKVVSHTGFLNALHQQYPTLTKLPVLPGSYAEAFDSAKNDLSYLLVVVIPPEHQDSLHFMENILLHDSTISYFSESSNNISLWIGSAAQAEAFNVATELRISSFPSAALIAHDAAARAPSMAIVGRIVNIKDANAFVGAIQNAIAAHEPRLSAARSQKATQQATRDLRAEQESAYERSLAADREKAAQRKQREEEAAAEVVAANAKEEREAAQKHLSDQWKRWRASRLKPEPDSSSSDVVRTVLRLPDGQKVQRQFQGDCEVEEVYAFVECHGFLDDRVVKSLAPADYHHEYQFRLVSPLPRQIFDVENKTSLKRLLGKSCTLIVEQVDEDEEDEEDDE